MPSLDDRLLPGCRYWTVAELKRVLAEQGLAIAMGPDDEDEMAITQKGHEFFHLLAMMIRIEAEADV